MILPSIRTTVKSGAEDLTNNGVHTNFKILDFWKWSMSNLLSNATRGIFSEYIVATAMGIDIDSVRDEWDAYDLVTKEGVKIEVKSASYIQTWEQKNYSKISFSIKQTKAWERDNNILKGEAKRHANIYVFCLLKNKNLNTINPLELEQWDFYVVPTIELDKLGAQKTISLNVLKNITDAISYNQLKDKINKIIEWLKSK